MKRWPSILQVVLLGWMLGGIVYAADAPQRPEDVVNEGVADLLGFLSDNPNPSPVETRAFLDRSIAPGFDFDHMAKWSAGRYLRRLSKEQRGWLAARLQHDFIGALARNLGAFARPLPAVRILPSRPGTDSRERVVPTLVDIRRSWRIRLDFRCYWDGERWKVFDVIANGASALAFFRSHYVQLIRQNGPQVPRR